MSRLVGLLLGILCAGFVSQSRAADFYSGYEAYSAERCKAAFRIWFFQASQGDAVSANALGLFELRGCVTDPDFDSFKNPESGIEKLKDSQQPELLYELAQFFDDSGGVFESPDQAEKYFERAYNLGLSNAAVDMYRLTGESIWRERAIAAGSSIAECDSAFINLEISTQFEAGLTALNSCPAERRIDGILIAVRELIKRKDPDRALGLLAQVPQWLVGSLGDEVALELALQEGMIREQKAEEFFRLAKLERNLTQIQDKCGQAAGELDTLEATYKGKYQALSSTLDKSELERALGRVIAKQSTVDSWCTAKIDSLTFSIDKALAALQKRSYEYAWEACKFFKDKDAHSTECNFVHGVILFYGHSRSADTSWGRRQLEAAAKSGYLPATLELAHIAIDIEPQLRNERELIQGLEKLTRSGSATIEHKGYAFMLLGNLEKRRQDEKFTGGKNYYEARKFYDESKALNYWPAYVGLGILYHENKLGLLTNRFERALENFRIAGDHDVEASFPWLCEYYATGKGTAVNRSSSNTWCRKAVEAGFSESRRYLD